MINSLKNFLIILLGVLGFHLKVSAQNKYTISGTVKDALNGEDLIGAIVGFDELPQTGTAANEYGFYSLTVPEGEYSVVYTYVGYVTIRKKLVVNRNIKLDIELKANNQSLKEVVISSEREDQNITKNQMSVVKISPRDIEAIPVLFGEKDVLKVMQLTPGVKSAGEGNSGFFVRGGAADQNLIILDEAPVYNASHLLGFFSVFNSDAIKDVTLYKGGMPAQFGGRASSVMDIKLKDGNAKKIGVTGGMGLISSKLTVEAPIVKDKGSFIVSGRRTYADVFLGLSKNRELRNNKLYFYDLTAKANYKFGEKDRVFLSGYLGRDNLKFGSTFGVDWGNRTGTVRWNHIFGSKLFSNTTFIFSDYNFKITVTEANQKLVLSTLIRDLNLKQDFSLFVNKKNTLKFGGNMIYHRFLPGNLKAGETNSIDLSNKNALESALYVQEDYDVTSRFSIGAGLRYSHFNFVGPSTAYTFDANGKTVSKVKHKDWKSIQQYHGFEPRVNLKCQLNDKSSVKASYNRNYQYIHLLSNTTSAQPNDVWLPSTNNVKPIIADQIALGYFRNFKNDEYELSVEGYYKTLQNQLDYKDGANFFLNETVENQLLFGKGLAYGIEFYLKKTKGKFTGWLSYTWSRSLKKIDGINNGKLYPAKQDRIHDVSIVGMYTLSERVKLSANWVYYTGNAVTFPSGRYTVNNTEVRAKRVPLVKEIEYLQNYIEMHKLRLGPTANVQFATSGDAQGKSIAPMLFIPFVENAFKYGISKIEDYAIVITMALGADRVSFNVKNVIIRDGDVSSHKQGLTSVKRLLDANYLDQYKLEIKESHGLFIVDMEVPLGIL